jgi:23S rRNA pseudouridine1911/1915/1917 synthase
MMPEQLQFTVTTPGERLDKILVAKLGERLSRAQIQALIRDGGVMVNGAAVKPGVKLKGGEQISITLLEPQPTPEEEQVEAEPIPLEVIYEDRDLAVINKPAGLVVHPGAGNPTGTLVNALLARYPQIAEMQYSPRRRGIVHRLDKDTSGLILVALRGAALRRLVAQFQARTVDKEYLALVEKTPRTSIGRIEVPIARDPKQRTKMAALRDGRPAVSEFSIVDRFKDGRALVRVKLLTGRTHQIRVHMAFIGCPIVGDTVYGYRKQRLLQGQFLHATRLCFDHPRTGERLCFESPLPERLTSVLDDLRRKG